MIYYEVKDNKIIEEQTSIGDRSKKPDISSLIVKPISKQYYIIINSFQNRCILIRKSDWDNNETLPEDLVKILSTPDCDNRDFFRKEIESSVNNNALSGKNVTFIIAPSYACNLRCSYCYQQHNKSLCKERISQENLSLIFDVIRKYKQNHKDKNILIGLFGGEPLLPENADIIDRVFDFCVENGFPIHITTNGTFIPEFMKKIVIHRGLNMQINTTIDSIDDNQKTRKNKSNINGERNSGLNILDSIYVLIHNKVHVNILMNIDKHNIERIPFTLQYLRDQGYLTNKYFSMCIGRVDDRLYETNYPDILSESEVIQKLVDVGNLPENVHASFIQAPYNLCRKVGLNFNQLGLKGEYSYCWAASPLDNVFYIDAQLDSFRCTYTVGRKEFSNFRFSLENIENYTNPNRTFLNYEDCSKCPIGGFCSGGCMLSALVDFKKQCEYEKKQFTEFLVNLFFPRVRKIMLDYFGEI